MDSNVENISLKISNLLKKYKNGMTYEEIRLALTSQWLRISEFNQRPINLQIKLFCTLLQFTLLSKEIIEGSKVLGKYFGKLLTTIQLNSLIWKHTQSVGSSAVQIMIEISKTGNFSQHILSLNSEDLNETIQITSLKQLTAIFLFYCESYSCYTSLHPTSSNVFRSFFGTTDIISTLISIRGLTTISKHPQPLLYFLAILSTPNVLKQMNPLERIQIVKWLTNWLQSEFNSSSLPSPPPSSTTSNSVPPLPLPPPTPTTASQDLCVYCKLYSNIIVKLVDLECLSFPQPVVSITCYDTQRSSSQKLQQQQQQQISSSSSSSCNVWNVRHRVGWIDFVSSSNNIHPHPSTFFTSLSPFIQNVIFDTLQSLPDQNFIEILSTPSPTTQLLILFFHTLTCIQSTTLQYHHSSFDPIFFQLILKFLQMDLFPQLVHEMMQFVFIALVSQPRNEEYSNLLEWLCTHSSKKRSGDVNARSSKRVRCDVSPSKVESEDEDDGAATSATSAAPKAIKLSAGSPNKQISGSHRAPMPPQHSSPSSKIEIRNGIAFSTPDKEERNYESQAILTHFNCLKELCVNSLSSNQTNDKKISALSQSIFVGEVSLLIFALFPKTSSGPSFSKDSPLHTIIPNYYDALWNLLQISLQRRFNAGTSDLCLHLWRNVLSSLRRFQLIFPMLCQQGAVGEEPWWKELSVRINHIFEILFDSATIPQESNQSHQQLISFSAHHNYLEKLPFGMNYLINLGSLINENNWMPILTNSTIQYCFSYRSNFQWSLIDSYPAKDVRLSLLNSFSTVFCSLPFEKLSHSKSLPENNAAETLTCLSSWNPFMKKLFTLDSDHYQKSLVSERMKFLSLLLDLLIQHRWNQFFSVEIAHLITYRTKSPFLSHLFPPNIPSTTILNCHLQHRFSPFPSSQLSLEHAVLLIHAATNMQSWLITNFSESSSHPLRRLDYSTYRLEDEVRSLGTLIFREVESSYTLLFDQISSNQMMNQETLPSNIEIWLDFLNLLNLFRTWTAIERCVQHVVEFSAYHFPIRSQRGYFRTDCEILELGKQCDEYCKLLSDYTPPNSSLSTYMSKLLGLGLLDATFKWREVINSSAQCDDHREDVWWEGLFSSRIDPGGLLGQVGLVLNIAATELAKDENERMNPTSVSSSPSLTATEKKRLIGNIWMCVPAVILLIECVSLTEPQIAIWGLSSLLTSLEPPENCFPCDWLKHMYLEAFTKLTCPIPGFRSELGEGGILWYLLNGDNPQLASDLFLRPILHSYNLKDFLTFTGFDFNYYIPVQQKYRVLNSIVASHDLAALDGLKTLTHHPTRSSHSGAHTSSHEVRRNGRTTPTNGASSIELLLSQNPTILLRMFALEDFAKLDRQNLLNGSLLKILKEKYGSPLNKTFECFPSTGVSQKILLSIVWALGSHSAEVRNVALLTLNIYSTLYLANSWTIDLNDPQYRLKGISSNLESNVSNVLNIHFLYLYTNAVQKQCSQSQVILQVHSIRVLSMLLTLLQSEDVVKYVPKILFAMDTTLTSHVALVRKAGVDLVEIFLRVVPSDCLRENLNSLIIGLYPIIERSNQPNIWACFFDKKVEPLAISSTIPELSEAFLFDIPEQSTTIVSLSLEKICGVVHFDEFEEKYNLESKQKAISVIFWLFTSRWNDILSSLSSVIRLPQTTEENSQLESIQQKFLQHRKDATITENVTLLCQLVKHESKLIRYLSVDTLIKLCIKERRYLFLSELNPSGTSSSSSLGLFILETLLLLSGRESDLNIRQILAKCLGEIGAIDPAKISFALNSTRMSTSLREINPTRQYQNFQDPPWLMNPYQFCLILVDKFLVPRLRLRESDAAQDRICYAIQKLLRIMAAATDPDDIYKYQTNLDATMPMSLHEDLSSKQILDIGEIFWSTRYKYDEASAKVLDPPIYKSIYTVERWLGLWCRHLSLKTKGGFSEIFLGLRGAVRLYSELGHFLLPYLLANLLQHPPLDGEKELKPQERREQMMEELLLEISTVLSGVNGDSSSSNQYKDNDPKERTLQMIERAGINAFRIHNNSRSHMSIHAIFTLLDTLSRWIDRCETNSGRRIETPGWPLITDYLSKFLKKIPRKLLASAAIKIGAYSRGLRYLELEARHDQLTELEQKRENSVVDITEETEISNTNTNEEEKENSIPLIKWNDFANGVLPPLTPSLIDFSMEIYAKLGDADALQGIEKLRQVQSLPDVTYNHILELEHTDSWMVALQAYDSLQTMIIGSQSQSQSHLHQHHYLSNTKNPLSDEMATLAYIERGRFHCLYQLGQLESLIDQANGISQRNPEIELPLLPFACQAALQLQQWTVLDDLLCRIEDKSVNDCEGTLQSHPEDNFLVSVSYVVSCLQKGEKSSFEHSLADARTTVMSNLASATLESYNRSYPFLMQLHILREIENSFPFVHIQTNDLNRQSESSGHHTDSLNQNWLSIATLDPDQGLGRSLDNEYLTRRNTMIKKWDWEGRYQMLSPSADHRSFLLAIRRSILEMSGMRANAANNWLTVSSMMQHSSRPDLAHLALNNALRCGLDSDRATIQQSLIVTDSGQVNKAMMLLEPVEFNIVKIQEMMKKSKSSDQNSQVRLASILGCQEFTEEKYHLLAQKLLLSAKLMSTSHTRHGKPIIERYKLSLDLHPKWEEAAFELGQYYHTLLDLLYKELLSQRNNSNSTSSSSSTSNSDHQIHNSEIYDDKYLTYCLNALDAYLKTVTFGNKHLMQALPRLLTLWFSITGMGRASNSKETLLDKAKKLMTKKMNTAAGQIPAHTWYACMPQIVSRIGHQYQETVNTVKLILIKIMGTFPHHGIWHFACLIHSLQQKRQEDGHNILMITSKSIELRSIFDEYTKLFEDLVNLARLQTNSKKITYRIGEGLTHLGKVIVPLQSALTLCYPQRENFDSDQTEDVVYFPTNQMSILSISNTVDVMNTKAKPKTIHINTTCGRTLRFLVKQEKSGDLRKDARMMEFNGVINRIMQDEPESRKRKLRLRTYSVVCLNEECGILEWVPNTVGLRPIIAEIHSAQPTLYPQPNLRDIKTPYEDNQSRNSDNLDFLVNEYRRLTLKHNVPCLHKWFLNTFNDPTEWLDSRTMFTRSCAVWSSVGHIIGLGDRHGENILIDSLNGECMHVDFDCIFDKGLTLAKPEIVPFRLTPNIVDAMGLTGIEGGYRLTMEVVFKLLRNNKDILLSVVEPFLRDPTVAWGRGGRAQRDERSSSMNTSTTSSSRGAGGGGGAGGGRDESNMENAIADQTLRIITERLEGLYNLKNPNRQKILSGYKIRKQPIPSFGLGQQDDAIALSVSGQVQKLIEEATNEYNLAQMFIGWMPWM